MVPHEKEECEWAVVGCSYQCGAHLPRRQMAEHEHNMCPQEPMDIKLERLEKQHEREMVEQKNKIERIEKQHEREMIKQKNKIAVSESKICEQEVTIRKMKVCGVPYAVSLGCLYSLDWTTGLDTGLMNNVIS